MATLPATQAALFDVPTVSADIPVSNLLRIVLQRVVDGEALDDSSRRALGALVNFAMEAASAVSVPAQVSSLPEGEYEATLHVKPAAPTKSGVRARSNQVDEGYYMWYGRYVKVQENQAGTGVYAKAWDTDTEKWEYTSGLVTKLSADMKLTAEDAAKFGSLYGRCVFCSQQLNDERSIVVGYGPVCAENHGLPWG